MKTFFTFCILLFVSCSLYGQDSLSHPKYKKVFPAIQLGGNKTGSWKGEAAFLLGLTNNSLKETKILSMIMHGPSIGCEMGSYNDAFRIAPKISYEYYTSSIGGRISLVDYAVNDLHNLYFCPEAGISFGGILNLYAGVSLPFSGNKVTDINTFRFSANMNILLFFFKKDKQANQIHSQNK